VSGSGYTLLGLTALVGGLVALFVYALLRFSAAAREAKRQIRTGPAEAALFSSAVQEAVSSLKAREQAMSARAEASEQLASRVFDSLAAGLIVVGADGRVRIANPAACRMLRAPETVAGLEVRAWLAGSPLAALIEQGLADHRTIARRIAQADSPEGRRHYSVTVSPLEEPSSGGGAICLFSDVTAVVDLEQQLQMKEALARLGEMTAGIAHEFRNSLATIHGYSRLLDSKALPAPYPTYVEGIRQETEALGHVVTNFLNFARPEQISMAPVDLEAAATRAVEDLRHELSSETGIHLRGTFGSIQGEEVLLRQVFGNLVRNAVEACVSAGKPAEVVITGEIDPAGTTAVVSVDDNGPGVPDDVRARIFQPFFTTRSRGSGLGLAIVQKIVLLHNGRVSVGSSPSGGAQFHLAFPLTGATEG
jgi:signal transduction histidine kinase